MGNPRRQSLDASFTSREHHDELVADLCTEFREADLVGRDRCNGGHSPYDSPSDVPGLNRVIVIDLLVATTTVEANMTMEALVQATLPFGFLPSVVAGDRTATVSDAFAATTSESSSFAFGTFDCTVTEIEIIMGDGQLMYARPDDALTADLFYGSAGGLNSLGLITALEICLVPAGPYVELVFQPASTESRRSVVVESRPELLVSQDVDLGTADMYENDAIAVMDKAIRSQGHEFVEAMLFHRRSGVVVSGRFAPKASKASYPIVQKSKDYIRLAAEVWRNKARQQICMPTVNYLFRNTYHAAFHPSADQRLAPHPAGAPGSALHKETTKCQSYGLPRHILPACLQALDDATCLVRAVMQPREVGRRQPLGIACPFEFQVDCCVTDAVRTTIETMLTRERQPEGFPFLQCLTTCQQEPAWALYNDRWHFKPWLFHDDRWYVELRSHWKAETIADVSERVACADPLRFKR